MRREYAFILLAIAWFCAGCGSSRNAPVPDIPPESSVENIPISSVAIPVRLSYAGLLELTRIEEIVPRSEDHNDSWREVPAEGSGNGIQYRWVREPFIVAGRDSTLMVSTVVSFQVRYARRVKQPWPFTNYTWLTLGSCGYNEPMPRVRLIVESAISVGEGWKLRTSSHASVQFLSRCEVSAAGFDVTGRLQELFETALARAAAEFDERISSSRLEDRLRAAWAQLQRPIPLKPDGVLALFIRPRSIALAPPVFSDSAVSFGFKVEAEPAILRAGIILPEQDTISTVHRDSVRSGFTVRVRIRLEDSSAQTLLESKLVGKEFSFPSGQRVTVRGVRVLGGGSKMAVGIRFTGQFDGELFFSGRPEFDAETQTVRIPDFDYDLKTRDWLVAAEEWLQHKEFVGTLKPLVKWELAGPIATMRKNLLEALNRDLGNGLRIVGSVSAARVTGFERTTEGISGVVLLEGTAAVESVR